MSVAWRLVKYMANGLVVGYMARDCHEFAEALIHF